MKRIDKLRTKVQFFAFAFYPKTTLLVCTVVTVIIVILLSFAMAKMSENSVAYNVVFTLTTGAVASFFVTLIVELSGNYRHNKLGFYELGDYYSLFGEYEVEKSVLMGKGISQRAEKLARQDAGIREDDLGEEAYDDVKATWFMLPKVIPVFKDIYDIYKKTKEFLSDSEIESLRSILYEWNAIRRMAEMNMRMPFMYEALNHPDEDTLKNVYPKNVLDDMPEYARRHLAMKESEKAVDTFIDEVLSDEFLMREYFKDYDISEQNLPDLSDDDDVDDISDEETDWDPEAYEAAAEEEDNLSEEEFKARRKEEDEYFTESSKPWISSMISLSCKNISAEVEKLEKINEKKPYYGLIIRYSKKVDGYLDKKIRKNLMYEIESKNLKKYQKK